MSSGRMDPPEVPGGEFDGAWLGRHRAPGHGEAATAAETMAATIRRAAGLPGEL